MSATAAGLDLNPKLIYKYYNTSYSDGVWTSEWSQMIENVSIEFMSLPDTEISFLLNLSFSPS